MQFLFLRKSKHKFKRNFDYFRIPNRIRLISKANYGAWSSSVGPETNNLYRSEVTLNLNVVLPLK